MGNKIFCLSSLRGATLCLLVNLPSNCLSQFSSQILRLDIKPKIIHQNKWNIPLRAKKKDSNIDIDDAVHKDTV
jgi:hypothetical protein